MDVKKIAKEHVLKISSGQVIVSLASALKELIENALDAGATRIDIEIQEHGRKCLEVRDNGKGVPVESHSTFVSRYTTSKITEMGDLHRLSSYGFRGEALNSLASVAKLSCITRTESDAAAHELVFDEQGKLVSSNPVAGTRGTTVRVADLFHSLPVRKRDLDDNHVREYSKLLSTAQAYAIICSQTSFSVSHKAKDKKPEAKVLQTPGQGELSSSLRSIYGVRFLANLEKFSAKLHDKRDVEVSGYVSKNLPEACKANGSQQMAFLNGRPVDLPKLVRIMNESYRALNPTNTRNSATPIFFLNFVMPMDMVDVNMSPDKRTVIFADQEIIFKMLQSALCLQLDPQAERTFALQVLPSMNASQAPPAPSTGSTAPQLNEVNAMEVDNPEQQAPSAPQNPSAPAATTQADTPSRPAAIFPSPQSPPKPTSAMGIDIEDEGAPVPSVNALASQRAPPSSQHAPPSSQVDEDIIFETPKTHAKTTQVQRDVLSVDNDLEIFEPPHKKSALPVDFGDEAIEIDLPTQPSTKKSSLDFALDRYNRPSASPITVREVRMSNIDAFASGSSQSVASIKETTQRRLEQFPSDSIDDLIASPMPSTVPSRPSSTEPHSHALADGHGHHGCCSPHPQRSPTMIIDDAEVEASIPAASRSPAAPVVEYDSPSLSRSSTVGAITASQALDQVSTKLPFNFDRFSARYRSRCARMAKQESQQRELRDQLKALSTGDWSKPQKVGNKTLRRFSPITPNATSAVASEKKARTEMTKQVSKEDFTMMKVIGQFNGSFIICKLDDELFILDQHACDEKFNFEQLCREKNVRIQRLIIPRRLELQPPDVAIILENLDEFSSRGFLIETADAPPAQPPTPAAEPSTPRDVPSATKEIEGPKLTSNSRSSSSFLTVKRENGEDDWRADSPNHRLQLVGYVLNQSKLAPEAQIHEVIEAIRDGLSDMKLESEYKRHASQACRMSVMFGDALPPRKMREIVANMSTMVQPWNCPHGRPTMRHLMTLSFKSYKRS